ncbi:hypothetical protein [Sphingobacterium sp. UDSM-2020]|uniref:hypothetical protein n=1 Tax=Sphingobacterium sp. UDSM-2020 TaxID=2795738 RepID=UPI0019368BE6|nr:hypothetical protein [Sphingobacterium sp. UDSM-2020]QQD14584.1 hypothetical protein JAZ75_03340 [Sphingobacterium sp. UDSM-2020]
MLKSIIFKDLSPIDFLLRSEYNAQRKVRESPWKSVKVHTSAYVISPYSDIARALAGQLFESGSSTLRLLFDRYAAGCRTPTE